MIIILSFIIVKNPQLWVIQEEKNPKRKPTCNTNAHKVKANRTTDHLKQGL